MKRSILVLPFFLMACGSSEKTVSKAVAPTQTETVNTVANSAQLVEALKTADAADGTEDKVAHKCSGCSLAMDGDAANTINVDGYDLYMCSAGCKSHFEKDLAGNLSTLVN